MAMPAETVWLPEVDGVTSFFRHYEYNVSPGPFHEPTSALPSRPPTAHPVRFIAYYLPQFHRSSENDDWWGSGFTEWTNVTKAVPRYPGHYQPRLPADLGFYDASRKETLLHQAELARLGGIYGFCIHDYWFSGRKLLGKPLDTLLANPDIDLRFCLNWANESWSRRWDGSEADVLMQQGYHRGDPERYVDSIAAAIRDPRYIRIDGRPLLMIYRPSAIPDISASVAGWRRRFHELGLGEPYLVMPQVFGQSDPRPAGFDAAAGFPPHGGWDIRDDRRAAVIHDPDFMGGVRSYELLAQLFEAEAPTDYTFFPGCCPMWDNEARKPRRGQGFYGSSPRRYGEWLANAARRVQSAAHPDERIVFINAWNEWAEGAYLEPDRHYGAAYLNETRRVHDCLAGESRAPRLPMGTERFRVRKSKWSHVAQVARAVLRRLRQQRGGFS
jgi:lipopolysaccharide biosynthesis protein